MGSWEMGSGRTLCNLTSSPGLTVPLLQLKFRGQSKIIVIATIGTCRGDFTLTPYIPFPGLTIPLLQLDLHNGY